MSQANSPDWPIHLGCPVWSCDAWANEVYPAKTSRKDWLRWYTQTFNTVEGNSTFYALPSPGTARRWASESAVGFKFCFKFPRLISHELALVRAEDSTRDFLRILEPLANENRLGPTFLQLGPKFGPNRLNVLESFLRKLPKSINWAVELRHHAWFDQGDNEARCNDLLRELEMDKVLFDSRPLYQSPPDDEIEKKSQSRKPKTPIRQTVTGKHPMLRIVGRNRIELADTFFDQWAPIISKWISNGLTPFVFTHAPNDQYAPALARRFAKRLANESHAFEISIPRPPVPAKQLSFLGDL